MDGSWLAAGAPDRAVVLPGSVPSCPTYPPTPAPTAAPTGPPTTAPATPPVVAPMAVPFSVRLMPEQPANSATIARLRVGRATLRASVATDGHRTPIDGAVLATSPPRRRGPSVVHVRRWIPACAGMTSS